MFHSGKSTLKQTLLSLPRNLSLMTACSGSGVCELALCAVANTFNFLMDDDTDTEMRFKAQLTELCSSVRAGLQQVCLRDHYKQAEVPEGSHHRSGPCSGQVCDSGLRLVYW